MPADGRLPPSSDDDYQLPGDDWRRAYDALKYRRVDAFQPAQLTAASVLSTDECERLTENVLRSDPLSLDADSPWRRYFLLEERRRLIEQDVLRTIPDQAFFRRADVQRMMTDILLVYTSGGDDGDDDDAQLGYRQGMHELLAPILYVVHHDAVDIEGYKG